MRTLLPVQEVAKSASNKVVNIVFLFHLKSFYAILSSMDHEILYDMLKRNLEKPKERV